MKKEFLIASSILFAFLQTNAQVCFKPGVRVGLNLSKLQDAFPETKRDFYIGAFGALKLSTFYTLQPKLVYSKQGGKGKITGFYYN